MYASLLRVAFLDTLVLLSKNLCTSSAVTTLLLRLFASERKYDESLENSFSVTIVLPLSSTACEDCRGRVEPPTLYTSTPNEIRDQVWRCRVEPNNIHLTRIGWICNGEVGCGHTDH